MKTLLFLFLVGPLFATSSTFTQTITINKTTKADGFGPARFTDTWRFHGFNPALGTLQSVSVHGVVTATLASHSYNDAFTVKGPGIGRPYRPNITLDYFLTTLDVPVVTKREYLKNTGPTVFVPWGKGHTFRTTLNATFDATITDTDDLNQYFGNVLKKGLFLASAYGNNTGGSINGTTTAVLTLTYTYTPTP